MTVRELLNVHARVDHRKVFSGVFGHVRLDDNLAYADSFTKFDDASGFVVARVGVADVWYLDKELDALADYELAHLCMIGEILEHEKRHVEQSQSLFQRRDADVDMLKDFIASRENPAYGKIVYWFDLCELDAYRESAIRAESWLAPLVGEDRYENAICQMYAAENNGFGMTLASFVGFDDMLDKLQTTMNAYRGLVGIERCSVVSLGNDLVARFARGLENRDLRLQSTMRSPSDAARQRDLLAGMACAVNPTYAKWFRIIDTGVMGTQFASAREWYSTIMPESLHKEHERHAHGAKRAKGMRVANMLGNIVKNVLGVSNIADKTYDLQL